MNCLDSSMDTASNSRFLALYSSQIRDLVATTHFTETEITSLLMVFFKLALNNGPKESHMTKNQFYQIFPVFFKIDNLRSIDRTLLYISQQPQYVSAASWIQLFELFTTKDLSMRMRFVFEAYNTKGTGYIDSEQISFAVESFFIGDDEDEVNELRVDMCETIVNKFDIDRDGIISYEDYSTVVSQQPCLIEFLGPLFPSNDTMQVIAHCANIESILSKFTYKN